MIPWARACWQLASLGPSAWLSHPAPGSLDSPLGVLPWCASRSRHRLQALGSLCGQQPPAVASTPSPPASSLQPAASPSGHFLFVLSTSLCTPDRQTSGAGWASQRVGLGTFTSRENLSPWPHLPRWRHSLATGPGVGWAQCKPETKGALA